MQSKVCPRCGQEKPLTEFGRNKNRAKYDGLSVYCKACLRFHGRIRRQKNPDAVRAYHREYRRKWSKGARGIYAQLKVNSKYPVEFTSDEFVDWFNRQEQRCYYCRRTFLWSRDQQYMRARTVDRKDPRFPYTLDNIVLACRRCNQAKSNIFTEQQMLEIAKKYWHADRNEAGRVLG